MKQTSNNGLTYAFRLFRLLLISIAAWGANQGQAHLVNVCIFFAVSFATFATASSFYIVAEIALGKNNCMVPSWFSRICLYFFYLFFVGISAWFGHYISSFFLIIGLFSYYCSVYALDHMNTSKPEKVSLTVEKVSNN